MPSSPPMLAPLPAAPPRPRPPRAAPPAPAPLAPSLPVAPRFEDGSASGPWPRPRRARAAAAPAGRRRAGTAPRAAGPGRALALRLLLAGACLLGLACAAAPAQAQNGDWTFDRVLQAAMRSHPSLLGKRAQRQAAKADLDGAQWQRYPSLTAEAGSPSNGGGSGVLRVDQTLWSGGSVQAGIDSANSKLDASDAAVEEQRLTLTLRVIAAYSEALRQTARLEFASDGLTEHEKLLAMIKRRVIQSISSQTDQRLAESRMYQAANEKSMAEQALRDALAQLSQLAGRYVDEVSSVGLGGTILPDTLEPLMQQALDYSPSMRRLAYAEAGAKADIVAKRSAYKPKVLFRLERDMGANRVDGQSATRASLVLQAQPGAGLSALSGVDAAVANREAARLAREDAERETRERVTLDWNEWGGTRQRLENARNARNMATEVFESYTRQYVIGKKNWSDVLNAVREATDAQLSLEDVRAQALAAGLRLSAEAGTLRLMDGSRP